MSTDEKPRATELRRRVSAGVGAIALQGAATQVVSLAGNLLLARILLPRDFGVLAFGLSLTVFLTFLAGAGLAAALIRREEPPTKGELEAFFGLQLAASVIFAAVTAAIALPFGDAGRVTALMVLSVPLVAPQAIPMVLLERELSFRPIALIGIFEVLVFYVWALGTVALGWGVWGLASALLVRAFVASVALFVAVPLGRVRPRLSLGRIKGLLAFGAGVQATQITSLLGEQLFNVGIAAVAGLSVLGLWALAGRLLQIPFFLFGAVWRVSFPGMARLLEEGEDPRPIMEQSIRLVSIATGLMLTPIAASAPAAIPAVLGREWSDAAYILPAACLGLMISGPISVATLGYLWALGDARTPLRAAVARVLVFLAIALPLLPLIGPLAIGLGVLGQALTDAIVLLRGTRKHTSVRVVPLLAFPVSAAVVVGSAVWLVAFFARPTLLTAVLTVALSVTLYVGAFLLAQRAAVSEFLFVAGRAMRTSLSGAA